MASAMSGAQNSNIISIFAQDGWESGIEYHGCSGESWRFFRNLIVFWPVFH